MIDSKKIASRIARLVCDELINEWFAHGFVERARVLIESHPFSVRDRNLCLFSHGDGMLFIGEQPKRLHFGSRLTMCLTIQGFVDREMRKTQLARTP